MNAQEINDLAFFSALLDDYKAGELDKDQAAGALFAFSAALRSGDLDAASAWAKQGRKLARDLFPAGRPVLVDEFHQAMAGLTRSPN